MLSPVDVIVPIYRGLQDVMDCLDSIKRSANQQPFELIVLDDCSPEPEISALLKARAEAGEFTLLVNEENLGFVGTVNKGMQLHPERDVLLLNSDTIVANDWLDRITRAAYAKRKTGTVTPFSNNATICSYPDFCRDNILPSNTPLPLLDQLFAICNKRRGVKVPSGVGFCMYIRRDCLNEVGYFDEETFGKGYGEENDFCQRAELKGWMNRFALDVFVQHTGNVSFGDSHNDRKQIALEKLLARHPDYNLKVQQHIVQDPAQKARLRVWLASLKFGNKPIVLHVSHNRGGGTARSIQELSLSTYEQSHSLILMPSIKLKEHLVLTRVSHNGDLFDMEESEYSFYFHTTKQQDELKELLAMLPMAGMHFHHMIDLPHWVMSLPSVLHLPWVVSVHDFYFVDPSITLTDAAGRFVGLEQMTVNSEWTATFEELLNHANHCFAPSQYCQTIYQNTYPEAKFATQYHEEGLINGQQQPNCPTLIAPQSRPLKVLIIGAISKEKGSDLLDAVAVACKEQDLPIEFELIGYSHHEIKVAPESNLRIYGRYQEGDLAELIEQRKQASEADVVWFTSLCPETYCYTLSSAIAAELPIIAPNIGAFSERLYGRDMSWIVPWDLSVARYLELFRAIHQHGSEATVLSSFVSQTPPAEQAFDVKSAYLEQFDMNLQRFQSSQSKHLTKKAVRRWLRKAMPLTKEKLTLSQMLQRNTLKVILRLGQAPILHSINRLIPSSTKERIKVRMRR